MRDFDEREARNPFSGPRADLGRRAAATDTIVIGVAVVAGLYFGREVLVPMSIAVLLSFVLAPVADALSRLRIGRVASVLITVALAFAILGVLGAVIGRQAAQLSENLPAYQVVIGKKVDAVRSSAFGARMVEKAADALHGLENNIGKSAVPAPSQSAQGETTQALDHPLVQVEVHEPPPGPVQILQSILSALLPPLATAAIVIIFVVFILLQRRDLRDRFIGLIGSDDLHRTTKALDDAAQRLSRYFLALTGINASFGVIIGLGLSLIGVPNPVLWGIVGAVLRFVPYAGAFIAAAIPLALAAAVDSGWSMVAETALLFVVVEGIMGQVAEICASVESVVADLSDHVGVADEAVEQATPQIELRLPQKPHHLASHCALLVVRRLIRRRAKSSHTSLSGSTSERASSGRTPYQSAGCPASTRTV
jgi:predicted PurR-regulated permease PerM